MGMGKNARREYLNAISHRYQKVDKATKNWPLHCYLCKRQHPVQYTCSRPYQKKDNAHIEEKNWSIVRQYMGNNRFDKKELTEQLNTIYTTEWRLLMNFFLQTVQRKIMALLNHTTPIQWEIQLRKTA